jgi:hypothetical protein
MEIWKAIPGHFGYEVSNEGRVRSIAREAFSRKINAMRKLKGCDMKPIKSGAKGQYLAVTLGNPRRRVFIHVLVLESFVGPRPNLHDACHQDGNPINNRLENLRWDTRSENIRDAVDHGRWKNRWNCGEAHHNSKLSSSSVATIRERRAMGEKLRVLAADFHVTHAAISAICSGRTWKTSG